MEALLTMNTKERERLKTLIRLEDGSITQKIAAQHLKISTRQLQRLYKAYINKGEAALISLKRGKPSNNRLKDTLKKEVIELIIENYQDFGPTFATEKLVEIHKLKISKSSVRNVMIANEIWNIRRIKPFKVHQRRTPRECLGELIQMDGSYHDWFEGKAPECCLIVLIDDATSRIMWLQFVNRESTIEYFKALKSYIQKYGVPLSIYTDRLAVFETTRNIEKDYKDTQFHRAISSIGIRLILAHSAEAKGRVERCNGILQDRLIKEMRLAGVSSMEEGNAFLSTYIELHNKKFAKRAASPVDAHKSLDEDYDLEEIFCRQFERTITKDLLVYFKGKTYQILEEKRRRRLGRKKILVIEKDNGEIKLIYNKKPLKFKPYEELPKEETFKLFEAEVAIKKSGHKPGEKWTPSQHHPWKAWNPKKVAI